MKTPVFFNRRSICVAALSWVALAASAQDAFPSTTIRLLVPLGPGSATDSLARVVGEALAQELKVTVVVENRPGAGGTIAANLLAKSKPDGHTIGIFPSSVFGPAAAVNANLPYDPVKDFTPLAIVATNPVVLAVAATSPFKTLEELMQAARKDPGKYTSGFIGVATTEQGEIDLLNPLPDAPLLRVPYAGGTGPLLNALLGGQIDAGTALWAAMSAQARAGKLRILGTSKALQDNPAPTFESKGYYQPHMEVRTFLAAPAGLPPAIQAALARAAERAIANPKTIASLEKQGNIVSYGGPREMAAAVASEVTAFKAIVARALKRR
jgi:tripartite-type tricarboxylate transporter receptor subunit TctC